MNESFPKLECAPKIRLVRTKRRTLGLVVTPEADVIVRAPFRASLDAIERWVHSQAAWIQKALARAHARPSPPRREFLEGEQFLYLGNAYPLTIRDAAERALHFENGFILREKDQAKARRLFEAWYRAEARKVIGERVALLARQEGLVFKSVKINSAKSRWGSCSAAGNLNFSWRLVMAPPEVIDYVVLHELAHLKHRNHSRAFWACVAAMCPTYAASRRWLRENTRQFHWA